METFVRSLKSQLRKAGRIAVLGVGSELRGDDVAGILAARLLAEHGPAVRKGRTLEVFVGDTAPENMTGEIKKFKPTHLVIIDSADIGKKAGAIKLIDPDKVGGISFSTHKLPLKILADYLRQSIGCEIIIIAIQPGILDFGSAVSREVEKSAKQVSLALKACMAG